MSTNTIEAPVEHVAPSETIVAAAAKALDDRKSKLDFAKQVEKSRNTGASDEDFAAELLTARVELAYGEGASVELYGKDFPMSASKVSQYGTTINQLREAKAPLTEETFGDWFKMTATGGSAKVRKETIAFLLDGENQSLPQSEKAALIRKAREEFFKGKASSGSGENTPRLITIEGLDKYLTRLSEQDWDEVERKAVIERLFRAGSAMDDGQVYVAPVEAEDEVEAETVAA